MNPCRNVFHLCLLRLIPYKVIRSITCGKHAICRNEPVINKPFEFVKRTVNSRVCYFREIADLRPPR